MKRLVRERRLFDAIAICASLACGEPGSDAVRGVPPDTSGAARATVPASARCYRSAHSVLLGPVVGSEQNGVGPGWLRIQGFAVADSGTGTLVDANGAGLAIRWRLGTGDSVLMSGADDFLRVELRLSLSDRAATGEGRASSDAGLERDASGAPRSLRREWDVHAEVAPCDGMPLRRTGG